MKSLTIRTAIALLTFLVGVAAATFWIALNHPPLLQAKDASVNPMSQQSLLSDVLYDFQFVGNGISSSDVPSHSMESLSLPTEFKAGQQYVFHHRATDNDLLFEILQNRFRSKSIKILAAGGGTWRYIGGLAFRISFEDEKYRGYLINTLDSQIVRGNPSSKGLSYDDYALVIEEVKGTN